MKCEFPIPADLAALGTEFEKWRRTRPYIRARFPEDLMRRAIKLVRRYPIKTVSNVLNVDRGILRDAIAKVGTGAASAPGVVHFTEVIGAQPVSISAVIEIVDPAGFRLRVSGGDMAAVVRGFMEARR